MLLVLHGGFLSFLYFDRMMTESAYTFRQSDLHMLDLNIDRGTDFVVWHVQWDSYCSLFLSGLVNQGIAKQVKALKLSCLEKCWLLSITQDQADTNKEAVNNHQGHAEVYGQIH